MNELVAVDSADELLIFPQRKVRPHGIEFEEDFLSASAAKHLTKQRWQTRPRFSDAFEIYARENPSAHQRKFRIVAQHAYSLFVCQFGDVALDDLRHANITQFRDYQLACGLHPNSVRRHINMLNAMLNMALSIWILIGSAHFADCKFVARASYQGRFRL
jgi:hypothetical protein